MELVIIEWKDAFGCSPLWQDIDSIEGSITICKSVGWLIRDEKEFKVIMPHFSEEANQCCGEMTIPASSIISMKFLNTSEK